MARKFIFNGDIVDEPDAVIPATNKAAFFSYGVYESLRVFKGRIFYPEWHMDRMLSSAKQLDMALPYPKARLLRMLDGLVERNGLSDALLRLVYYGPTEKEEGILIGYPMGFHFYPDKAYRKGMGAITYEYERPLPQAKTLSLLPGYLAIDKATRMGAIEAILIDRAGNATEGTRSNLFVADAEGRVATAPLKKVLEGISRKVLFENRPEEIPINEREIPVGDLLAANEVFLTSTVFGVMPIVTIDGKAVGDGKVGPVTTKLSKAYDSFLKAYCEK